MFCRKCGKELEDTLKFCKYCGEPLKATSPVKNVPLRVPKKRGILWKIKIFFGILLILAVLIAVGAGMYYFSDAQKFNRYLDSEEWGIAAIIYEDMVENGRKENAEQKIEDYVEKVKNKYVNQEITLEEALEFLDGVQQVGILSEELNETKMYIETLGESRTAYDLAEKYFEEKDYENALRQYQLVKDIDENYQNALDKSSESKILYKEQICEEVKQLAEEERYSDAMVKISSAQQFLGNDTDLTVLATQYEKASLEAQLDECENTGDYKGAITLLEKYSDTVENESDLRTRKEKIVEKYRDALFAEARNAYAETGYATAVGVLNEGLQVLPGDTEIQGQIENYINCMPVGLQTLTVISTQSSSLNSGYRESGVKDLYDNEYRGYFAFSLGNLSPELKYVEFFADKQYSHFCGKIFISPGTNKKYTAKLIVYADGVEVYDSGYINRETKVVEFDIPINHAENLKIEASAGESAKLILTDAYVYNTLE